MTKGIEKMEDRLETIIRDWLSKEFKNPDALPKPMLRGLAEEINKHRWEIYNNVQEEYDLEDIDMVAEGCRIELTDEERKNALYIYKKLENSNLETLEYIICEIKYKREESLSSSSSNNN